MFSRHSNSQPVLLWNEELMGLQICRWRHVLLRLGDRIGEDARRHGHLAPYLAEAFQHAVAQLLLMGEDRDLMALNDWLEEEDALREMRIARAGTRCDHASFLSDDCSPLQLEALVA